ncbi:hypothetical protein CEXT_650271 [Caerostris extrusa]|uniref:Uncharacterized protein n=1 Tax=Caerostris extrusa TaxID=172846 RepID=A0AAV4N0E3_CAEEX|nr:hypothetical protein CEXT_650271 [Caerostris extrusa]
MGRKLNSQKRKNSQFNTKTIRVKDNPRVQNISYLSITNTKRSPTNKSSSTKRSSFQPVDQTQKNIKFNHKLYYHTDYPAPASIWTEQPWNKPSSKLRMVTANKTTTENFTDGSKLEG